VTINCGYQSDTVFRVIWVENQTITDTNKAEYQLNNALIPMSTSLTVFSINYTTSFFCQVRPHNVNQGVSSRVGTVTVIGM